MENQEGAFPSLESVDLKVAVTDGKERIHHDQCPESSRSKEYRTKRLQRGECTSSAVAGRRNASCDENKAISGVDKGTMLRAQPDAVTAVLFVTAWDELEVKVRLKEKKGRHRKTAREPKQVLRNLLHDMLHLPFGSSCTGVGW
jgi:hypothetical protein